MICKKRHFTQPGPLPLIPLGKGLWAIVDKADYAWLSQYRWFPKRSHSNWYAVRRIRKGGKDRLIRMHREITNCPPDQQVHHWNGNTLDNRRSNMLNCTPWVHQRIQQFAGPHHEPSNAPHPQPSSSADTHL